MYSDGYLEYDPRSATTRFDPWWLILRTDLQLVRYYRYWIRKEASYSVPSTEWLPKAGLAESKHKWHINQRGVLTRVSAWGPHVSVIRGERPVRPELWGRYAGRKITFEYNPEYLNTNGAHWWIRVVSPELENIREELGLTPQPISYNDNGELTPNPFHLTIGYVNREMK